MAENKEITEYYGLGEQDEILENKISEILEKFNSANDTNFFYSFEDEGYCWSVSESQEHKASNFFMTVIFDDECMVTTQNDAEKNLVEEILDAMQEYSNRQGFPESLRLSDYEDYANETIEFPSSKDFFQAIKDS
jgi:hypothetical protein